MNYFNMICLKIGSKCDMQPGSGLWIKLFAHKSEQTNLDVSN